MLDKFVSVEVGARERPWLVVSEIVTSPSSVEIGKSFKTMLIICSNGQAAARSVSITFLPIRPIATAGSGSEIYLGNLNPGEMRAPSASFETDPEAFAGLAVIPYVLRYADEFNEEHGKKGNFGLSLYGTPPSPLST